MLPARPRGRDATLVGFRTERGRRAGAQRALIALDERGLSVAEPYETYKAFSDEKLLVVPEEHCHDGIDGNGNGLVDETCWGEPGTPPPPGAAHAPE